MTCIFSPDRGMCTEGVGLLGQCNYGLLTFSLWPGGGPVLPCNSLLAVLPFHHKCPLPLPISTHACEVSNGSQWENKKHPQLHHQGEFLHN